MKVLGCYWRREVTPEVSADRPKWATASSPGSAPMGLLISNGQYVCMHGNQRSEVLVEKTWVAPCA